jgi:hypothetical protein
MIASSRRDQEHEMPTVNGGEVVWPSCGDEAPGGFQPNAPLLVSAADVEDQGTVCWT